MSSKRYRVKELASMAGVTVRALHHYDAIGLLVPSQRSEAGHRLYDTSDVETLYEIVMLRSLGLALEEIRRLVHEDRDALAPALRAHRRRLLDELDAQQQRLAAVDGYLHALEKGRGMNDKEDFDALPPDPYADEAAQRWGHTDAYRESAKRTKRYGPEQWRAIKDELTTLLRDAAALMASGSAATSPEALEIAERHRQHIERWFYPCSPEMHAQVAEMYTADPRFEKTFEEHGPGLAAFFQAAVKDASGRPG